MGDLLQEQLLGASFEVRGASLMLLTFSLGCLFMSRLDEVVSLLNSSRVTESLVDENSITHNLLSPANEFFFFIAAGFGIVAHAPITLTAARLRHGDAFSYFQPFEGGTRFVLCQMIGWIIYSTSVMFYIIMLSSFESVHSHSRRATILLSLLCIVSQLLLNGSLGYFDPENVHRVVKLSRRHNVLGDIFSSSLTLHATRLNVVCFITMGGFDVAKIFLSAEDGAIWLNPAECYVTNLIIRAAIYGFFISVFLTHISLVPKQNEEYSFTQKVFRPMMIGGGEIYFLLQSLCWSLALAQVALLGTVHDEGIFLLFGSFSAFALPGFVAQILMLVALTQYKSPKLKTTNETSVWRKVTVALLMLNSLVAVLSLEYTFNNRSEIINSIIIHVFLGLQLGAHGFGVYKVFGVAEASPTNDKSFAVFVYFFSTILFFAFMASWLAGYDFRVAIPFGAMSQLLLSVSLLLLDSFEQDWLEIKGNSPEKKERQIKSRPRIMSSVDFASGIREVHRPLARVLVSALWAISVGTHLLDFSVNSLFLIFVSVVSQGASVACMHAYSLSDISEKLPLFLPFQGPPGFVILQAFGWVILAFSIFGKILGFGFFSLGVEIGDLKYILLAISILSDFVSRVFLRRSYFRINSIHDFENQSTSLASPKAESWSEEEIRELKSLQLKNPRLKLLLEAIGSAIEQNPSLEINSLLEKCGSTSKVAAYITLGVATVLMQALALAYSLPWFYPQIYHSSKAYLFFMALAVMNFLFIHIKCGSLLFNQRHKKVFSPWVPLKGGLSYSLLVFFSAFCLVVGVVSSMISFNYSSSSVSPRIAFTSIGLFFYVSQGLLLWSLAEFQPYDLSHELKHAWDVEFSLQGLDFIKEESGMLVVLVLLMVACFDIMVVRFGFGQDNPLLWVIVGVFCVCFSAYWTYMMTRRSVVFQMSDNISTYTLMTFAVAGLVWTFTILLFSLLALKTLNAVFLDISYEYLIAPVIGGANLLVRSLMTIQEEGLLSAIQKPAVIVAAISTFILASVFYLVFRYFILPGIRFLLDVPFGYAAQVLKREDKFLGPDGQQALENIHLCRNIQFAKDSAMAPDVLSLDRFIPWTTKAFGYSTRTPIIYFHGGGHICVKREVLHHSMTPFARHGFALHSVEYPLSPEYRNPIAVLCCLRSVLYVAKNHCPNNCIPKACLQHSNPETSRFHECGEDCRSGSLETNEGFCLVCGEALGVKEIILMGDSAGGNLATMCTALLCDVNLRNKTIALGNETHDFKDLSQVEDSAFPQVKKLVSIYGLMSRRVEPVEPQLTQRYFSAIVMENILKFIFGLYDGRQASDVHGSFSTLTDLDISKLDKFADEAFFICGEDDPLLFGNKIAVKQLKENPNSFKVRLKLYPGTHAFHGFPASWARSIGYDWKENALIATMDILDFLTEGEFDRKHYEEIARTFQYEIDNSPIILVALLICFLIAFFTGLFIFLRNLASFLF